MGKQFFTLKTVQNRTFRNFYFYLLFITLCFHNSAFASCGNGVIEELEECDPKVSLFCKENKLCGCNCMCISTCGNGFWGEDEECDDGNEVSGDGCSKECKVEHVYCHERCVKLSDWYIGGYIVNSAQCPNNEINEWSINNNLNCCCKLKGNDPLGCRKYEKGDIKFKDVIKSAETILESCVLADGLKAHPFKHHKNKIDYKIEPKIDNAECGLTDCDKKSIVLGVCNPSRGCSTNLCAQAVHELGHFNRCNISANSKDVDVNQCNYIGEEIIVEEEGFKSCIGNSGEKCNCEYERIYILKECKKFRDLNCKGKVSDSTTAEVLHTCSKFVHE